ncbi:FecR family protein [Steroidobacter flavus]|uniref:FecR family protein n=1 Tax=Steroidobacter flavus TaxID=1842136 RepID=A0ABV8T6A1_9GAMM
MASQEAAYWYIRCMDEPVMKANDRRLLLRWLRRSPENIAEFLRIIQIEGCHLQHPLLDVLKEAEQSNVYDIGTREQVSNYEYNPSPSVAETVRTKLPAAWAFAAMIAVLAVVLGFGFAFLENSPNRTVTTVASQWQHMTLDDGSTVHMDARTKVKIEFSDERRLVHLLEGRAVFEVAKDKARPFTVRTHIVDVTAVGTRFEVAINPGVTTTVSEGVVRVTPHGKLDDEKTMKLLYAGEELHVFNSNAGKEERAFGGGGGYVDLSKMEAIKVDAELKLQWTNGWLTLSGGEPIGDIVAQFNRRNAIQIKLENDGIATTPLKGNYYRLRLDSPESFVRVLESQEGIVVIRDRGDLVRLKLE